ncbi:MAG: hypothetical protein ACKO3F_05230 [Cyanobium sp.]
MGQLLIGGDQQQHWLKPYGSRAQGRQRPGSDSDLAFSSEKECRAEMSAAFDELPAAFDELPAPYLVDVTHWQTLQQEGPP